MVESVQVCCRYVVHRLRNPTLLLHTQLHEVIFIGHKFSTDVRFADNLVYCLSKSPLRLQLLGKHRSISDCSCTILRIFAFVNKRDWYISRYRI